MSGEGKPAVGDFPPGSRIAGYQIQELIGRGGMAVVYRASDVRLDRPVALKVLAPELTRDSAFRQRFIRESRSGASVDHPNVIPVFEAGEAEGVLFIAMRYVAGRDIRALIDREGPLRPSRVVGIVTQIASALDAAHAHGLVHRDVKPANMLLGSVASGSAPDHVYLSDFGLSKVSVSAVSLTGTGQFLGTIDYMSPEQVEGRAIDGRTDLYALACAAFEMLTGRPPFQRDQDLAVMWAQVSAAPPSVRQLRPELPAEVDAVMAKALAKSPDHRHASCLEFAAALRSACSARPARAAGGPRLPTELAEAVGPAPATELAAFAAPPAVGSGGGSAHPPVSAVTPEETITEGVPAVGGGASGGRAAGGGRAAARGGRAVGGGQAPAGGSPAGRVPRATKADQFEGNQFEGNQYGGDQYGGNQYSPPSGYTPPSRFSQPPVQTNQLWRSSHQESTYQGRQPRRGKAVSILLGVLIVAVVGGAAAVVIYLRGHGSPQGGPTSPVTVTEPASPSGGRSGQASQSPTPTTPGGVVTAYYEAINRRDYATAWKINQYAHKNHTYSKFQAGYQGTKHTNLTITGVSGSTVSFDLTADQTDGTVKTFRGTYTVQDGQIVGANVTCAAPGSC